MCAVVAGKIRICARECVRVCEEDKHACDVCAGDRRVYEGEKCVFARERNGGCMRVCKGENHVCVFAKERNVCACLRGRKTCGRVGEGVCACLRGRESCVCVCEGVCACL